MVFQRILRAGEGRMLKRLRSVADQVNVIEDDFVAMSDAELREETERFRKRVADGEDLDDIMPEAFAVVREASKRTLHKRHFDVQIMGGAALHLGNIAEMKTGEGKTLVSTLPAYLNALAGKGVHVVTVNDYLARRDAEWMGRIHHFLGLSVGVILSQMRPDERRVSYACDITYGTNNEFGFDYLRDNMAWTLDECVQRGHHFAIVDEVDSILIDEARTPLIISGPAEQSAKWYQEFARLVPRLIRDIDYEADEKKRTVAVTEAGVAKVEDYLGIDNLYESVNTPLVGYLNNALKAKELYKRDVDYIVNAGEVLIVDEFTGRVLHGRRYSEGMHQAIEAKEGVEVKQENQTLATITLQNYFRLYDKLGGMTGTAMTEAPEFDKIYKLGVIPIPTNRPMIRADQKDLVYKSEEAKFKAVVDDIAERYEKGQPVLVGTVSVEKSERLSSMLLRRGVPHEVLNAKYHEKEAAIVAQAGRKGAVTVATNMAGRGTDIMLGGNPEFLAASELRNRGLSPVDNPEEYEAAWPEVLERMEAAVQAEHDEVVGLGGLYVLGTERHESRRIDNQLRGRSGRQGDPGESRFYLSLQDDLMRLFNSAAVESIMDRLNIPEDVPIEAGIVTRAIRNAQSQVEAQNFEIRKNVLKYDEVLNRQREVIYSERRRVLEGADLHEQVRGMIDDVVRAYVQGATEADYSEEWDLDQLWTALRQLYPVGLTVEELGAKEELHAHELADKLAEDAQRGYDRREAEVGPEVMREVERRVILSVLDRKWREHLYEMDYLQEGIGLRAVGQRDPLVEYQREGFDLFVAMMDGIKEESVSFLFNLEIRTEEAQPAPAGAEVLVAGDTGGVVAGEPVPSEAPAAFVDEPTQGSLDGPVPPPVSTEPAERPGFTAAAAEPGASVTDDLPSPRPLTEPLGGAPALAPTEGVTSGLGASGDGLGTATSDDGAGAAAAASGAPVPGAPATGGVPAGDGAPVTGGLPSTPGVPTPGVPSTPGVPPTPGVPSTPGIPATGGGLGAPAGAPAQTPGAPAAAPTPGAPTTAPGTEAPTPAPAGASATAAGSAAGPAPATGGQPAAGAQAGAGVATGGDLGTGPGAPGPGSNGGAPLAGGTTTPTAPATGGTTPPTTPAAGGTTAPGTPPAPPVLPKGLEPPPRPQNLQYTAPSLDGPGGVVTPRTFGPTEAVGAGEADITGRVTGTEPSRNAPCPCGSGKKYKRCHGAPAGSH